MTVRFPVSTRQCQLEAVLSRALFFTFDLTGDLAHPFIAALQPNRLLPIGVIPD